MSFRNSNAALSRPVTHIPPPSTDSPQKLRGSKKLLGAREDIEPVDTVLAKAMSASTGWLAVSRAGLSRVMAHMRVRICKSPLHDSYIVCICISMYYLHAFIRVS